jgi:protein TonB
VRVLESHRSPVPLRRLPQPFDAIPRQDSSASPDPENQGVLTGLSETIQAGQHRLDPILEAIADAALHLTRATGAAVAMWKDGAMVCRARSGETAPPLGASVSTESGISGECLRTGTMLNCEDTQTDSRVVPEVCASLGLRSIAVVPIIGWHGINGLLEVFSTEPHAFTEEHLGWLKKLASLAEKARALRPHAASAVAEKDKLHEPVFKLSPESDRLRDVVFAAIGGRRRMLVFGIAGMIGLFLLGAVIWLGFHTPDAADATVQSPEHAALGSTLAQPTEYDADFKPNPGGKTLAGAKPSAGTAVKLAAKLDRIPQSIPHVPPPAVPSVEPLAVQPETSPSASKQTAEAAVEPPQLAIDSSPPGMVNKLLSAPVQEPGLAIPISRGVSNGYLIHRVSPVYPPEARQLRLQGEVRVDATISEQGTVENLRLVAGQPILGKAAIEAIRQWRYRPYQLNGKPVKIATTIIVNFKLPQ